MKEASKLYEFFRHLAKSEYDTENEFLTKEIPTLVSILGYSASQLFFEVGYRGMTNLSVRADAVVTTERTTRPWLLIETRLRKRRFTGYEINDWKKQLLAYKAISQAKYAILLEPSLLFLADHESAHEYTLDTISVDQASEIYERLKCPPNFSNMPLISSESPNTSNIYFETFSLDLAEYLRWL